MNCTFPKCECPERDTCRPQKSPADLLASVTLERDRLRKKLDEYDSLLCECEDYFDNRADADMGQDGWIPNTEMVLLTAIRARGQK